MDNYIHVHTNKNNFHHRKLRLVAPLQVFIALHPWTNYTCIDVNLVFNLVINLILILLRNNYFHQTHKATSPTRVPGETDVYMQNESEFSFIYFNHATSVQLGEDNVLFVKSDLCIYYANVPFLCKNFKVV